MSPRLVGSLFALSAALVWGSSWIATRVALDAFSSAGVAAWRGIATVLLMTALLAVGRLVWTRRGPSMPVERGRMARYLVLAVLGGPPFVLGMTLAVELTGATIAAFAAGLYPVLATSAAPMVLPERPSVPALAGVAAAFAGVVLLAGFHPVGPPVTGILVALGAAASFAAFLLFSRRWSAQWRLASPVLTVWNFALVAAVAVPLALAADPRALAPTGAAPAQWIAVLWLGLGPGVLAHLFVLGSVRRLPAHESSAFLMVNPLAATLLASALLGERLGPVQLAGAALVLAGIALATLVAGRTTSVQPARDGAAMGA